MSESINRYVVKDTFNPYFLGKGKTSRKYQLVPEKSKSISFFDFPEEAEEALESAKKDGVRSILIVKAVPRILPVREDDEFILQLRTRMKGLEIPFTVRGSHLLTTSELVKLVKSVQRRPILPRKKA